MKDSIQMDNEYIKLKKNSKIYDLQNIIFDANNANFISKKFKNNNNIKKRDRLFRNNSTLDNRDGS